MGLPRAGKLHSLEIGAKCRDFGNLCATVKAKVEILLTKCQE
jgi:hypothetical protein